MSTPTPVNGKPAGSGLRNGATPPPAAPPVVDTDIDLHLGAGSVPAGWSPAQWSRVQRIAKQRDDALARAAKADEHAARVTELEGHVAATTSRYEAELAMVASGLPMLAEPEVRDFVRERYQKSVEGQGDKAPAFADWLKAQQAKPSPILAPYLAPAAPPVVAPAPPAPGTPPPKVETPPAARPAPVVPPVAQPAPASPGGMTAEQIAALSASPASFRANQDAMRATLEAKYGVSLAAKKSPAT